jgi:hypothetical protein
MEENQESINGIIENLALVTDAMQTIFPDGKMICVYELDEDDYKKVQKLFRKIDHHHNRFSVDISDLEHVFINRSVDEEIKENIIEEPKEEPKKTLSSKISSWFKSGRGTVK